MTAKVLNAARLNRKLAALPLAARQGIEEAIAKSAREIADLAEILVSKESGKLAGSIGWTWGAAPKGSIAIGQVRAGSLVATVYAGDDEAYYARWVEFGTQQAAAHPFFFPAYRALRKRAKSRIRRAGTVAAKKVAAS